MFFTLPHATSNVLHIKLYILKIQVQLQANVSQVFKGQHQGKFEKQEKMICNLNS